MRTPEASANVSDSESLGRIVGKPTSEIFKDNRPLKDLFQKYSRPKRRGATYDSGVTRKQRSIATASLFIRTEILL